jgi:hypothetical protein
MKRFDCVKAIMENEEYITEYFWTPLLLVTGVSFLFFCFFLKMLSSYYPPIFLWIGLSGVVSGIIAAIGCFLFHKADKL